MNFIIKKNEVLFDCGCSIPINHKVLQKHGKKIEDYENGDILPRYGIDIKFEKINKNCPEVWKMLAKGCTKGVFQLESQLGKQWTKRLRPTSIEHIGALGAILRPGCLECLDEEGISTTEHYCARKNKEEVSEIFHPSMIPALEKTYNVMIYQEQAMKLSELIAGFNLQEADMLRKAIGKKLPEEMAKCKKMFIEGAKKLGVVTEQEAEIIFDMIEKSQRYSFNKCVSGKTIIKRMFNGKNPCILNVAEMYRIRNNIEYAKQTKHLSLYKKWKLIKNYGTGLSLFNDKRIHPNIIIDIKYAGKQELFRITTESGKYIDVTSNHKFPFNDTTIETKDLKVGDNLLICGEYEASDFASINKFSKLTIEDLRQNKGNHDGKNSGFMTGVDNPGYTNGAYTEFETNIKLLENKCGICGKTNCRLEVHHKDKNRENNKLENLIKLCVSCHKKEDYKLGRTKVGEKGYPVIKEKIISIVSIGVDDTYDVTMDAPNHTFVANDGILTCNSHAFSYGVMGYWTAYAKAHFPLRFFTSWLRFSSEKQHPLEEIRELVDECKLLDIEVLTPKLQDLKKHFYMDGEKIRFGLSDIKGIGESQVDKIRVAIKQAEEYLKKPFSHFSWYDFVLVASDKISVPAITNLISVGAIQYGKYESNRNASGVQSLDNSNRRRKEVDSGEKKQLSLFD